MLAALLQRPLPRVRMIGEPALDPRHEGIDDGRLHLVAQFLASLDGRLELVPEDVIGHAGIVPPVAVRPPCELVFVSWTATGWLSGWRPERRSRRSPARWAATLRPCRTGCASMG